MEGGNRTVGGKELSTNISSEANDVRFVKDGVARALRALRAATDPDQQPELRQLGRRLRRPGDRQRDRRPDPASRDDWAAVPLQSTPPILRSQVDGRPLLPALR